MPKGCPDGGPMYGFVPFGAGKRTCPGQRLAMLESVIILASIVKHFQFRLAYPDQKIEKLVSFVLQVLLLFLFFVRLFVGCRN